MPRHAPWTWTATAAQPSRGTEGDPNYLVWFNYVDEDHDDNDSADVYFVPENYSTARGEARHGFWHVVYDDDDE